MRLFAALHKKNKVIARASAESDIEAVSLALSDCMEKVYRELDLSEPVWVTKHAKELSRFNATKFLPEDFLEPVNFDYLHIEFTVTED